MLGVERTGKTLIDKGIRGAVNFRNYSGAIYLYFYNSNFTIFLWKREKKFIRARLLQILIFCRCFVFNLNWGNCFNNTLKKLSRVEKISKVLLFLAF